MTLAHETRIVGEPFVGYTDVDLDRVLALTIEQQAEAPSEFQAMLTDAHVAITAEIARRALAAA